MPKLPNPELVSRTALSPGGVSGQLRGTMMPDIGVDTSIANAITNIGEEGHAFAMREKAILQIYLVNNL